MDYHFKRFIVSSLFLLGLPLSYSPIAHAAKSINLRHQPISILHHYAPNRFMNFKELNRSTDRNQMMHVRMQQTYNGYDILGADFVVHVPNSANNMSFASLLRAAPQAATMNGIIYQNLDADLNSAPTVVFTQTHAAKALNYIINQNKYDKSKISDTTTQLMIYIGEDQKAHWAYKVTFLSLPATENDRPTKPVYIIDAMTFSVYMNWDEIKTNKPNEMGGGFGGNNKIGKLIYDGQSHHLSSLNMFRDDATKKCYHKNNEVIVSDYNSRSVINFACNTKDADHNNVYWAGNFDEVNGGYSPGNDALFGGQVIRRMYEEWYGMPVLKNRDGSPMVLKMVVHKRRYDNAYWDGSQMTFGDGYTIFYPLVSLGVAAHEISHGFTEQHSNLIYTGQSGGMNESFSDMAAQAAEVYAYGPGKNSWQIGPEIFKAENEALRYMDVPSKDCNGGKPGQWCSIDDASQYRSSLDVHYSSGVYNRFFYTLGTTKGWEAKKAFEVMLTANANYWTANTNFKEAACGVISAAADLKYDVNAVKAAFDVVKVDYKNC